MSDPEVEKWLHRCRCCSCGAVLWIDIPQRLYCLCGASWMDERGTLGGKATSGVTDAEMIAEKKRLDGRDVTLEKVE